MASHEYTVEFRIWGDTLDPEQVTRDLGLEPCQTRIAGTPRRLGRVSTWDVGLQRAARLPNPVVISGGRAAVCVGAALATPGQARLLSVDGAHL